MAACISVANIRLDRRHVILLRTMGWSGGHLHEFEFAEGIYSVPYPDAPDEMLVDESTMALKKALGYIATISWTCDLGDDWSHKVNVERVDTVPAELKLQYSVCLTGARA